MSLFVREGTLPVSIFCKISQVIAIHLFYNDWEVLSALYLYL